MSNSSKIAVVIPTRNRADLAMNAISSVLNQATPNVSLIVSDNSTAESERTALREYCERMSESALHYIVPPKPLSMAQHWDWAMQQALQFNDAHHFVYLTDRSIFKTGELPLIAKLVRQRPDKVISYDWVTIFDHLTPITILENEHTAEVTEISASRLLADSAESIFPRYLPRMMTCCAPRHVIEAIRARFGNVFGSISPDYNFCYRCLHIVDTILYYDQAVFVSYALARSNGVSATGITTEATDDFASHLNLNGKPRSFATPVPAFETGTNYILHEYCVVKAETASEIFPEISRRKYLARNARDIMSIQNGPLRRKLEAVLKAQPDYSLSFNPELLELRSKLALRKRAKRILRLQWPRLSKPREFSSVGDAMNYVNAGPVRP